MMILVNLHVPFLILNILMHPFAKGETKSRIISLSQKVSLNIHVCNNVTIQ